MASDICLLVKIVDVVRQLLLLALQIGLHSRSGDHYKPAAGHVSIGTNIGWVSSVFPHLSNPLIHVHILVDRGDFVDG